MMLADFEIQYVTQNLYGSFQCVHGSTRPKVNCVDATWTSRCRMSVSTDV